MSIIAKKIKTILSIDPKWAYRFLKKRAVHRISFYWSRLIGRKYWDANIDGIVLRFAFFAPYQHRIAYRFHKGELFEWTALRDWKEKAKSSSVIYDIGGFSGIYGLLAAKVNPKARVVIFEPDAINARHIRENIKINGLANIELREVAVADTNGTARFSQGGSTGERLSEWGSEVRVETLDSLPAANLIKIDVEGAETKVIAGGLVSFAKTKPIISLEVHPWITKEEEEKMWASLKSLGYSWRQEGGEDEGNPHFLLTAI
jgi:FkbM family methyltransferase